MEIKTCEHILFPNNNCRTQRGSRFGSPFMFCDVWSHIVAHTSKRELLHLSLPAKRGSGLSPRGKNCCHTYPNDKLLHLSLPAKRGSGLSPRGKNCCHTYPNDKLLHLSLPAKRGSGLSPRGKNCCHTYPNDKLLQPERRCQAPQAHSCHTYPNDKLLQLKSSTLHLIPRTVVIPIQTISFYNQGCRRSCEGYGVVIPIQTISFYNSQYYSFCLEN